MDDSGTISQENGFHQKRARNDHTLVPGSEDVASKRVRFADDTEPAIHMSTAPSRNQPSSSHTDDFINIDDLRDPSFLHANVPTAVVDRIRVQMESWDRIRPDWEEGTKRGELKCAHKFANHQGSRLKGPERHRKSFCTDCPVSILDLEVAMDDQARRYDKSESQYDHDLARPSLVYTSWKDLDDVPHQTSCKIRELGNLWEEDICTHVWKHSLSLATA
ncbi:MAG: hypothetical protein LQ339_002922 [Xanthoria mediterranea]|nr:MAG: hypothetical protein LQ339_002922 [Xanthoria mediterranea]